MLWRCAAAADVAAAAARSALSGFRGCSKRLIKLINKSWLAISDYIANHCHITGTHLNFK